jgi:hypothetical protein
MRRDGRLGLRAFCTSAGGIACAAEQSPLHGPGCIYTAVILEKLESPHAVTTASWATQVSRLPSKKMDLSSAFEEVISQTTSLEPNEINNIRAVFNMYAQRDGVLTHDEAAHCMAVVRSVHPEVTRHALRLTKICVVL